MIATSYDQIPSVFSDTAFRGHVYGVTGSAHGIGEATVKQLTRLGASVVLIDLDKQNLKRVEADLEAFHASAFCLYGDVADERVLKNAIRAAHKRWGRIDGWVNNAMYNPGHEPESLPARDLMRTWDVNIKAAWVTIGLLTPIMKAQGGGSIVNISSIMAHLPQSRNAAYSTAKAALEGMTRSLAVDLAPIHVRVNAVVPGAINTRYEPPRNFQPPPGVPAVALQKSRALRRRMREYNWRIGQAWPVRGEARDVADAILFLLSDAARFVTGASLNVDGGCAYRPWLWDLKLPEVVRDMKAQRKLMKKYPALRMRNLMRAQKKRLRGKRKR